MSLRVPEEIKDALRRIADDEGLTVTDVALEAFRQYIRRHPTGGH